MYQYRFIGWDKCAMVPKVLTIGETRCRLQGNSEQSIFAAFL